MNDRQIPLLFDDDSDWSPPPGWSDTMAHACVRPGVRCYFGSGPREGTFGVHAADCRYNRPEQSA